MLANINLFGLLPAAILTLAGSATARTWLQKSDIRGHAFYDTYSFYDGRDPTHGDVDFAQGPMLSWVDDDNRWNMKVSTANHANGNRGSVRMSSNYWIGDGVIIANITHAPTGCGVWPAFWTLGEGTWPYGGEIDILEWANDAEYENGDNSITLHTQPGCSVDSEALPNQRGKLRHTNCHGGCQVRAQDPKGHATAGLGINAAGGVTVAMERDFSWGGKGIRIWQWARNETVPADVAAQGFAVDTSSWGTPTASFPVNPSCKFAFNQHQIIWDITLGGDWAAGAWGGTSCNDRFGSISNLIDNHGNAFSEAYWSVDSVMHYV
ncbi:hypothetical protein OC846_002427 [Tilletia horrida]|uniref:GH16 domain-containing protein n=1 Tax=Tilletia horrida TaxID=155126 RepID=A0AAN6JYY4_9BASI|nr:hypothetical protein OC846_002427 [Tilletia horrida]KAK0560180.1 hypothetical protein OC861_006375 [Tilletia horrida]